MLARWLPFVRARVGEVAVGCQPDLGHLLQGQFDGVSVVSIIEEARPYEAWAWLFSVPPLCQLHRPSDVPPAPYLRATEVFRCLPGACRVGLCWAGSAKHTQDFERSTALAAWGSVLQVPGVTFYSLQVGPPAEQLGGVGARIQDLSGELTDWRKTAAAMMQLDLVISVDTAVAHLAGALGVPVWICLPKALEWRWPLEGTETPWYSSARLFRPTSAGDWAPVFAEVARALASECQLGNLSLLRQTPQILRLPKRIHRCWDR